MFSISKSQYTGSDKSLVEAVCLSTDTKQTTGIANGSLCLEMDTNKVYYFDGVNEKWAEIGTEYEPVWQTVQTYTATYTASMKTLEATTLEGGLHFTPAIGDKYRVSINGDLLDQVFDITDNQGQLYMTANVYSGNFDVDYGFYVKANEYNPMISVLHNFSIADGDTRLVTLEKLM